MTSASKSALWDNSVLEFLPFGQERWHEPCLVSEEMGELREHDHQSSLERRRNDDSVRETSKKEDNSRIFHCEITSVFTGHGDGGGEQESDCMFLEEEVPWDDEDDCSLCYEEFPKKNNLNKEITFEICGSSSSECDSSEVPFWFGDEDKLHVKKIILHYEVFLGLDKEQRACRRAPKPFIGKIQRMVIENNDDVFQTVDTVSIYARNMIPPELPLPFCRSHRLLATWNVQTGLPSNLVNLAKCSLSKNKVKHNGITSWLYCRPVYCSDEYVYSTDVEDLEIGYSNAPFSYYPFLPKKSSKLLENDLF